MTTAISVGFGRRVARRGLAIGLLAVIVGAVALTTAPAASAAPAVVNVTVECPQPLPVTANVGDTIVFTFASSCTFDPGDDEWNIWNLEDASNTASHAGFLSLIGSTATRYPNCRSDSSQCEYPYYRSTDDWSVSSGTTAVVTVTTVLSALNGQGLAIGPGAALGVLNNNASGDPYISELSVAILWAGPRTSGDAAPVMMWQQSYGRASATDSCQSGYTPSWDTWPNGGTGGFVCNRFVPEYGN